MTAYKRITMLERKAIEEGLDDNMSFAAIAALLGRSASSVAAEVKSNRHLATKGKAKTHKCGHRCDCRIKGLCEECLSPSITCVRCAKLNCESICPRHLEHVSCGKLLSAPWVCNGCKRRQGYRKCQRPGRYEYTAAVADRSAKERRSSSRRGVNMTAEGFAEVLSVLRSALARNLSPYEIGQLYKDGVAVSPSTIYRWVERGYGGMANIELERKVGFRPRRQVEPQRATRHGKERSYEAFCALDQDEQDGCCEMDTVMGLKTDTKCLLTLYLRPAHFQLVVLLEKKRINEVVRVFDMIEAMSRILFTALFSVILTDNGCEFEDPEALERSAISGMPSRCRVFYCDPRQSQQKGRCEKNHSELRQLLPKGRSSLDPLTQADIADINCKLNSTPRKSLLGRSPIESLVDAYGCRATEFMDAFSIDCLEPDDIDLNPLNTLGDDPDGIPF